MVQIKDLVNIKKDSFFNGAVQAEWFYDDEKRKEVSDSYIFHGPKYYGVSESDLKLDNYKLIDTVTFTKNIYDKIYENLDTSRFMLTIAGYGSGKSHLSLALATLLSNLTYSEHSNVLENIKNADIEGYQHIKKYEEDKHLVLILNGINDFNLNMEVLKVAKQSLKLHKLDDSIFDDMTIAYNTAKTYLNRSYDYLKDDYLKVAKEYPRYCQYTDSELKSILLNNIEDYDAYSIVNRIYKNFTGNEISISEGISANTVLTKLHEIYVLKEKKFKSIVILFDEFGRYLEFASNQPLIAGETGLQQIFEGIQNSSPDILFIGFIQSDLNAYIARVKNENINRYVGRYQVSDKYYLSSNLETVVASLIKKNECSEKIIDSIFDETLYQNFQSLQKNIMRWLPNLNVKKVWSDTEMFNQILLKGAYPIHPLTVALLSSLSSYMQQRSTLAFLSDIFEEFKDAEINEKIPFIYPIQVIDSDIFNEILNAEERGRVSGQCCMQFRDIIFNNKDNLDKDYISILQAVLIMNLSKYKILDKADAYLVIKELTGIEEKNITKALVQLEVFYGFIFFDIDTKRYSFMNDGNSKVDFNKLLFKKKQIASKDKILDVVSGELAQELGVGKIEESEFGILNNIVTGEWCYYKELINIEDFNQNKATQIKSLIEGSTNIEDPRGRVISLYCTDENYYKIEEVTKILSELEYEKLPIVVNIIYDVEKVIFDALFKIRVLNSFSVQEKESFKKFYDKELKDNIKLVIRNYTKCAAAKKYITSEGIHVERNNIRKVMNNKFAKIYTKTIPFTVDSFEKKVGAKSRRYYYSIIDALLSGTLEDEIKASSMPIDIKNRIDSIFSIKMESSWKVLFCNTISSSQHPVVNEIANEIINKIKNLKSDEGIKVKSIISKYRKPPYGLNEYSLSLLVIYSLFMIKDNLIIINKGKKCRLIELKELFAGEKTIRFSEFEACEIFYTTENQQDKIISIIDKIEKNRGVSIEVAVEIYNELKEIDDNDIPAEIRGRFFNCKEKIGLAYEKNIELNKVLDEFEKKIYNIKFTPWIFGNLVSQIAQFKNSLIPNMNYMYSADQINRANEIIEKASSLFKNNLIPVIKAIDMEDNVDYEKSLNMCIKKLEDSNLVNSALIELTKKELEIYINKKLKYKKSRKEYLKLKEIVEKLAIKINDPNELDNIEKEIAVWNHKKENYLELGFKNFDNEFQKIDTLNKKVLELKEIMNETMKKNLSEIDAINNVESLKIVINKINLALNNNLKNEFKEELISLLENLNCINNKFSPYLYKNFNLAEIEVIYTYMQNKFKEKINILNVVNKIYQKFVDKHQTFELHWKEKYIIDDRHLKIKSVTELLKIKNDSMKDLDYLSNDLQVLQKGLIEKIDLILENFKVDNIITLFSELSDVEKQRCVNILQANIK